MTPNNERRRSENVTDVVSPDHAPASAAARGAGLRRHPGARREGAGRPPAQRRRRAAAAGRPRRDLCQPRREPGEGGGRLRFPHGVRSFREAQDRAAGDAQTVARGDRDPGHHRLPPAGDPRRDRAGARRRPQQGHARPAVRAELDQADGPPPRAGQARSPGAPPTSSSSISACRRSTTCRATRK